MDGSGLWRGFALLSRGGLLIEKKDCCVSAAEWGLCGGHDKWLDGMGCGHSKAKHEMQFSKLLFVGRHCAIHFRMYVMVAC